MIGSIQSFVVVVVVVYVIFIASIAPTIIRAQSPPLLSYTPVTDVTNPSTIDVDQQQIEALLVQITVTTTNEQRKSIIDQAYTIYLQRFRTLSSVDGALFRKPGNTNEFFDFYNRFLTYMGDSDYAHDFITSGFNGAATIGGYSGNFDFTKYQLPGGLQNVIQLGTILLTLVQYIVRNLDVAIEECIICSNSNNDTVAAERQSSSPDCGVSFIDEAAAYYVGSLQSSVSNSYEGYLLYGTADRLCQLFNTCDGAIVATPDAANVPTSRVNMIIMQQLINMQQSILDQSSCTDAVTHRDIIVAQLFIPMIQGTIRSVHYTSQQSGGMGSDFCNADATMYAAAILPLINHCSVDDADVLFDHTKPDRTITTNATAINELLIRNYPCLGVTTDDIGTFNPDIMVEWGTCGQPTPAPVVAQPTTAATSPPSSLAPASTAPITATTTSTPTMFIQPPPPAPIAAATTSGSSRSISSWWCTTSTTTGTILSIIISSFIV